MSPIVIVAKIIIQDLWIQKLDWDESVPMRSNLMIVDYIKIPRFVNTAKSASVQIHGFSDASIRSRESDKVVGY